MSSSAKVAFIGQSLGSHAFSQEFYDRVFTYCVSAEIASVVIVLADKPHRFSIMALKGLSELEARNSASRVADEKFRFLRRVVSKHPSFTIHRWRDFEVFPAFSSIHDVVYREYESCAALKDAVDSRFLTYVNEQSPNFVVNRAALDLGTRYILDELTLMLLFYGPLGYRIQIAPFNSPSFLSVALTQGRIASLLDPIDSTLTTVLRRHVALVGSAAPVEVLIQ